MEHKVDVRVIGEIGEYAAQKYLQAHGYNLLRYGAEMRSNLSCTHIKSNLERVSDHALECNFDEEFSLSVKGLTARKVLNTHKGEPPYGKHFLIVNLLVLEYIQRFWWRFNETNKLPHNGAKILQIQKTEGIGAAEVLKQENRAALKKFPGANSHPGRYDFLGYKANEFHALEVKVNSSKLSYWQSVRLALLQKYGCPASVVHVEMTAAQIQQALNGAEPAPSNITIKSEIKLGGVTLPTDEQFLETLAFSYHYEDEI